MIKNKLLTLGLCSGIFVCVLMNLPPENTKSEFFGYQLSGNIALIEPEAAMLPPLETVEETTRDAQLIVYGEIEDLEYRSEEILPQTIGTIRVEKCLKGDVSEGSLVKVRKHSGYTTPNAQKIAWFGSILSEEELEIDPNEAEDLQLSLMDGDWPLEKNSKHLFCLYPQNEENGQTIYNVVWGVQSEWIEMSPDSFYEPAAVRSHFTSDGSRERLLQKPYTSNPPLEDGDLTRGKSLSQLEEIYQNAAKNEPSEKEKPNVYVR